MPVDGINPSKRALSSLDQILKRIDPPLHLPDNRHRPSIGILLRLAGKGLHDHTHGGNRITIPVTQRHDH